MFPPKLDCWKLTPLKVTSSEESPPEPTNQQFTKLNMAIPPLILLMTVICTHCPQTHMGRLPCSHSSTFMLKSLSPAALWLAVLLGSGTRGQSAALFHWSRSGVSDSLRPRGLQPTSLLCPWDSPGKNSGVGCHFLLHFCSIGRQKITFLQFQWRTGKPGMLQSTGLQRTGHNWATEQQQPILGVNPAPYRAWECSKEMFSGLPWWFRG